MSARTVWPSTGRMTLALLVAVPAAMAYPWSTTTGRWVLGVAIAVVLVLLAFWRGCHLTTIGWRRLALLRARPATAGHPPVTHSVADARTTVALRVLDEDTDDLPAELIADYLDRYGVRCESIRITRRRGPAGNATWVSLTVSAAANLAALQARSAELPLRETAEVVLRRLADQLREAGWQVSTAQPVVVPDLLGPQARQRWRAVADADQGFVAAYTVNDATAVLAELRALPSDEVWTVVEFTGGTTEPATACAIRSDELPGSPPLPFLRPQNGLQRDALDALHPLSGRPLIART